MDFFLNRQNFDLIINEEDNEGCSFHFFKSYSRRRGKRDAKKEVLSTAYTSDYSEPLLKRKKKREFTESSLDNSEQFQLEEFVEFSMNNDDVSLVSSSFENSQKRNGNEEENFEQTFLQLKLELSPNYNNNEHYCKSLYLNSHYSSFLIGKD